MTRAQRELVDHLETLHRFLTDQGQQGQPEWEHRTYEGLVRSEGEVFDRKPLPREFRRMRMSYCFDNAFHCVMRQVDGDRFLYVEGFAAGIYPTMHAWVLDQEDGLIFDPTWPRDQHHDAYMGIAFPTAFVLNEYLRRGAPGLLCTDWMFDNHILANGRSLWTTLQPTT